MPRIDTICEALGLCQPPVPCACHWVWVGYSRDISTQSPGVVNVAGSFVLVSLWLEPFLLPLAWAKFQACSCVACGLGELSSALQLGPPSLRD